MSYDPFALKSWNIMEISAIAIFLVGYSIFLYPFFIIGDPINEFKMPFISLILILFSYGMSIFYQCNWHEIIKIKKKEMEYRAFYLSPFSFAIIVIVLLISLAMYAFFDNSDVIWYFGNIYAMFLYPLALIIFPLIFLTCLGRVQFTKSPFLVEKHEETEINITVYLTSAILFMITLIAFLFPFNFS
ncbi:MAG TPA: hypothetical protein VKM55_28020 [Candidatus Lokiarchaeia archaeon]|nr:hypothetical protein [Candidatus Lokiarchaeia archaeon]